jgi:hypothetical protein
MLGRTIHGSIGIRGRSVIEVTTEIEGTIDSSQGLGYLPINITLTFVK